MQLAADGKDEKGRQAGTNYGHISCFAGNRVLAPENKNTLRRTARTVSKLFAFFGRSNSARLSGEAVDGFQLAGATRESLCYDLLR